MISVSDKFFVAPFERQKGQLKLLESVHDLMLYSSMRI